MSKSIKERQAQADIKLEAIIDAQIETAKVSYDAKRIEPCALTTMLEKALETAEANGYVAMYCQDKACLQVIPYWECESEVQLIKCLGYELPIFADTQGESVGVVAFRDDGIVETE